MVTSSPHGNGARDAREDMKVEGSMCKAYHLVAAVTELIVRSACAGVNRTSPARELHPATHSTRLRAGPGVRGEERAQTMQRLAQVSLYGKVKTPPK